MDYLVWPGLVLLGIVVGAYGTMIGAGGGFVLVPVLLLLYPSDSPELITSISLAVVFVNAFSGTIAYVRQRRVDFFAANMFAAATIPGSIVGALVVGLLPRNVFDVIFAFVLLAVSALIILRPAAPVQARRERRGEITRMLTDAHGDSYIYSYNPRLGVALSVLVGFLSSLLGIGGGVIHVPIMVLLLHFPAHVATATSQYVLAVSAFSGTLVHISTGELAGGLGRVAALSVGVFAGAQLGALVSMRVRSDLLIRLLGFAMAAVAVRLLLGAAL